MILRAAKPSASHSFLSVFVFASVLYRLFYHFASSIWSHNIVVDPNTISPALRGWYLQPRDGFEGVVIYVTLVIAVFVLSISSRHSVVDRIPGWVLKALLILCMGDYFRKISFKPPFPEHSSHHFWVLTMALILFVTGQILYSIRKKFFAAALSICLVPICLLATGPQVSVEDYGYILDPALKLLKGFKVSEIYFQYDFLLSALALPLLRYHLNPLYLQILGQISLLLLFLSIFAFSSRFFLEKKLAVPCLLIVVISRLYCTLYDPTFCFQITPLRLDIWIFPLFVVYIYGLLNWRVGVCLGLIILMHRNFGVIYSLGYLQALMLLIFLDLTTPESKGRPFFLRVKSIGRNFMSKAYKPLLIIAAFQIFAFFIFHDLGLSKAAKIYQSFGFGFDRISENSFFWYVPLILFSATVFLANCRNLIPENYFNTFVLALFLMIGNSLYFLGRSHESNLTWISGSIILVFFGFIDLLIVHFRFAYPSGHLFTFEKRKNIIFLTVLLLYLSVVYQYSGKIEYRIKEQYTRALAGNYLNAPKFDCQVEEIKKVTKRSDKVFAALSKDFCIYYEGNWSPLAYFTPYDSWIIKDDQIHFIQDLLDRGYFVVRDSHDDEISKSLKFDNNVSAGKYYILSKNEK